jgi:hypothetical protein
MSNFRKYTYTADDYHHYLRSEFGTATHGETFYECSEVDAARAWDRAEYAKLWKFYLEAVGLAAMHDPFTKPYLESMLLRARAELKDLDGNPLSTTPAREE